MTGSDEAKDLLAGLRAEDRASGAATAPPTSGALLRKWRRRRQLTQLDCGGALGGVGALSQLHRERPLAAQPGDGVALGPAPRHSPARPQPSAARGRIRTRFQRALARPAGHGTNTRDARTAAARAGAVPGARRPTGTGTSLLRTAGSTSSFAASRRSCSRRRRTHCASPCTQTAWRHGSATSASGAHAC
jgi:hypothetical protein